jgi:hypothetical protein
MFTKCRLLAAFSSDKLEKQQLDDSRSYWVNYGNRHEETLGCLKEVALVMHCFGAAPCIAFCTVVLGKLVVLGSRRLLAEPNLAGAG